MFLEHKMRNRIKEANNIYFDEITEDGGIGFIDVLEEKNGIIQKCIWYGFDCNHLSITKLNTRQQIEFAMEYYNRPFDFLDKKPYVTEEQYVEFITMFLLNPFEEPEQCDFEKLFCSSNVILKDEIIYVKDDNNILQEYKGHK